MISDGPRISLSLCDGFDCLVEVSAHSDLCNVYVSVAHCHARKVFLLRLFTACRELCSSTVFVALEDCPPVLE